MAYVKRTFISTNKRSSIQSNLTHMLKRHRSTYGLTQKQLATELDLSTSRYRSYEVGSDQSNPLIDGLDEISRFAAKLDMETHEFVYFALNGSGVVPKQGLLKWQSQLLTALRRVNQKVRADWSIALGDARKDKVERCLGIMSSLLKLGAREVSVIEATVDTLVGKKGKDFL